MSRSTISLPLIPATPADDWHGFAFLESAEPVTPQGPYAAPVPAESAPELVVADALSPEDGLANLRRTLAEFGPRAMLIVYQDTPMFQAESCAYANRIGGCPGKANCRFESMEMVSNHGERVTALDYHCRTIVLNQGPFCVSPRLPELVAAGAVSVRADFVYRPYAPKTVVDRWRTVRRGEPVPGGHAANFDRGVL